jgi:hypothetical protein
MMTRFRTYCRWVLPALLFTAGPVAAQELNFRSLPADPGRAIYAPTVIQKAQHRGTTALALPFFDDFTSPIEGAPNMLRWEPKGGALVNNRFALAPLTRGTATLDGLKANGLTYGSLTNPNNANLDSLISLPISLANVAPSSNVFLSFAWQAGTVQSLPNRNSVSAQVRLELFVKTNTNTWESKWSTVSTGRRTPFRQQVVALDQARYMHGNFQFMFVATGNTTDNSDTWSIDYVLLNSNRTATDTIFVDAATGAGLNGGNPSGGLRSPLRRYSAMPVWQYNAASPANSELNPVLGVNVTNLNTPLPLSVVTTGTVQELPTGTPVGTWLQNSNPIPGNTRREPRTGDARTQPIPLTAAAKRLRYTMAINSREPATSPTIANDTIYRDVELNNYYAYDDGTAEGTTYLTPSLQNAFAYRFDLNQADYVRGLRLYPVFSTDDLGSRTVTVSVWDDDAGKPAAQARASKTYTIQAPYPTGWSYYQVDFDQPVPVSGTFYVGFTQAASSTARYLYYGVDYNNTFPSQYLLARRSAGGAWDTISTAPRGTVAAGTRFALMMRPVMTNTIATASVSAREAAVYELYPNPAHGTVTINGPAFARATLLDAVGRTVWEQPAAQAGNTTLPLPSLPAGVYTVRLTLTDGRTVGRRLMLE